MGDAIQFILNARPVERQACTDHIAQDIQKIKDANGMPDIVKRGAMIMLKKAKEEQAQSAAKAKLMSDQWAEKNKKTATEMVTKLLTEQKPQKRPRPDDAKNP